LKALHDEYSAKMTDELRGMVDEATKDRISQVQYNGFIANSWDANAYDSPELGPWRREEFMANGQVDEE
jgi:hypothetical protein